AGSLSLGALVARVAGAAATVAACSPACGGSAPDCCGDHCVDLTRSLSNCGACGKACGDGQVCAAGQCIEGDVLGPQCDPKCAKDEVCLAGADKNACCKYALLCGGVCLSAPPRQCQAGGGGAPLSNWCWPADRSC